MSTIVFVDGRFCWNLLFCAQFSHSTHQHEKLFLDDPETNINSVFFLLMKFWSFPTTDSLATQLVFTDFRYSKVEHSPELWSWNCWKVRRTFEFLYCLLCRLIHPKQKSVIQLKQFQFFNLEIFRKIYHRVSNVFLTRTNFHFQEIKWLYWWIYDVAQIDSSLHLKMVSKTHFNT